VVPPHAMQDWIATLSGRTVRLDPRRTPVWFCHILHTAGAILVEGIDPTLRPSARRSDAELDAVRQAHDEDGLAMCRFLFWLEREGIGRTESEVADKLLWFRMRGPTCLGASVETTAATGANAALPHYRPDPETALHLQPGGFVLVDGGGQYPGGAAGVTRTVWLGDAAPPPVLCREFTAVLKAYIALASAVFPDGTFGHRLDVLARVPLWQLGLDRLHEGPLAFTNWASSEPIHAGMVLNNEPGFYRPGSHGIRLENAMQVLDADVGDETRFLCFETLTLAPFDRRAITPSLLSQAKLDWIDAYHADVAARLAPSLDAAQRDWLSHACRPLLS
jgi:Xaa-Pro aminopeptidase